MSIPGGSLSGPDRLYVELTRRIGDAFDRAKRDRSADKLQYEWWEGYAEALLWARDDLLELEAPPSMIAPADDRAPRSIIHADGTSHSETEAEVAARLGITSVSASGPPRRPDPTC
jgi:hypothetical protein